MDDAADLDAADLDAAAKLDAAHLDAAMWRATHGAVPDMAVSQATPPVSRAADDELCASFAELFTTWCAARETAREWLEDYAEPNE